MSPDVTRATRELQQLQQDIDRHRRDDAIENMRRQEFDSDALPSVSVPAPQGRYLLHLKALEHTPSSVKFSVDVIRCLVKQTGWGYI